MKGIPFRGVLKNAFRADTLGGTGEGRGVAGAAHERKANSGWSLIFYVTLTTTEHRKKVKNSR